jgi:hypothetical protein
MDCTTLARWRDIAVPRPATEPVDAGLVTKDELTALELLRREGLGLEQERMPMDVAQSGDHMSTIRGQPQDLGRFVGRDLTMLTR